MVASSPSEVVATLAATVGVELHDGRIVGRGGLGPGSHHGLFGGQVVARCLHACAGTVQRGSVPDSIHVNLLAGGDASADLELAVERVRDGRNLQHRDVRATQGSAVIAHAAVVAAVPAPGLDWQRTDAGGRAEPELADAGASPWAGRITDGLFEVAHPSDVDQDDPPSHPLWLRCPVALPDDAWLHGAVAAFWSDFGMNWSARSMHQQLDDGAVTSVSATHSLWIHRRPRVERWHLLDVHAESLSGNQGFVQARLFDEAGALVASISQGIFVRRLGR